MASVLKFERQTREEIPEALREFIDTVIVPILVRDYLAEKSQSNLLVSGNCSVADSPATEESSTEVPG